MTLYKATFENEKYVITVYRNFAGGWWLKIKDSTHHSTIHTKDFSTYAEAVNFAFENFNFVTD